MKNHIVFFGYTSAAQAAIDELRLGSDQNNFIIVTKNEVPRANDIQHYEMDFLNIKNIRDKKLSLNNCKICVVFSEYRENDNARIVDMNTVLTVYNIKKEFPDIHIISEIIDTDNTTIINDLHCDDIIYKETLDASLIVNSILHPNISSIFYDLLTNKGKVLNEIILKDTILINNKKNSFKEVRELGLEMDCTFIGYIGSNKKAVLMPKNSEILENDSRLVYIE